MFKKMLSGIFEICSYKGGNESCWSSSDVKSSFNTGMESNESGVALLERVPVLDV